MVMLMAKSIAPDKLGEAIRERLKLYHEDVVEKVDKVGLRAVKDLVEETAITAPRRTGAFRRAITYKKADGKAGNCATFIWGVKAPYHRLTHLLVHGHPTSKGGRVPGDPFLEKALGKILPEYEKQVEEALQDAD
jgi:hypothetical protein